ncbi:hypothetical protein QVD17_38626 [Tagetes erecta]|uniref:Phylloplanin n=1 Tax=Tagetes erecta TaxID=13708 RepID=A0AAD8JNT6_TARER|nr:hypothetical protein QVD17_38626 [Tagetes erecta]
MAMKSIILITVLIVVLAATQVVAQTLADPEIDISGTVPCSVTGSIAVNGTNRPPPFPNAVVQLSCDGSVRATAITNETGAFTMTVSRNQVPNDLNALLSSCMVVVATPLSTCDPTLPSTGNLLALLSSKFPLEVVQNLQRQIYHTTRDFQFIGS